MDSWSNSHRGESIGINRPLAQVDDELLTERSRYQMRVRIHRGTKEVGGNCIELSSAGKTLLLDMGMPLTAPDPANVKLPQIDGLQGDHHNLLGIVVSHPHFDHHG